MTYWWILLIFSRASAKRYPSPYIQYDTYIETDNLFKITAIFFLACSRNSDSEWSCAHLIEINNYREANKQSVEDTPFFSCTQNGPERCVGFRSDAKRHARTAVTPFFSSKRFPPNWNNFAIGDVQKKWIWEISSRAPTNILFWTSAIQWRTSL